MQDLKNASFPLQSHIPGSGTSSHYLNILLLVQRSSVCFVSIERFLLVLKVGGVENGNELPFIVESWSWPSGKWSRPLTQLVLARLS